MDVQAAVAASEAVNAAATLRRELSLGQRRARRSVAAAARREDEMAVQKIKHNAAVVRALVSQVSIHSPRTRSYSRSSSSSSSSSSRV